MLTRSLLACFAIALAAPVHALSCMRPDVVRLYEQARDSEDLYSMVIGRFDADTAIAIPEPDTNGTSSNGTKVDTTARFQGRGLTSQGFTALFDRDVTVRATCLSAWCASAPDTETEVFVTMKHEGDRLILALSPCPFNALPWTAEDEARVLNCHRFEKCAPTE